MAQPDSGTQITVFLEVVSAGAAQTTMEFPKRPSADHCTFIRAYRGRSWSSSLRIRFESRSTKNMWCLWCRLKLARPSRMSGKPVRGLWYEESSFISSENDTGEEIVIGGRGQVIELLSYLETRSCIPQDHMIMTSVQQYNIVPL